MEITSDNNSSGVLFVQSKFYWSTTGITGLPCHNIDAARNVQPKKLKEPVEWYLLMDIRWTPSA